MNDKQRKKDTRVAPDDVLCRYVLSITNVIGATSREIEVSARTAADAVFIGEFNFCTAYDFNGRKIEYVYSIRSV